MNRFGKPASHRDRKYWLPGSLVRWLAGWLARVGHFMKTRNYDHGGIVPGWKNGTRPIYGSLAVRGAATHGLLFYSQVTSYRGDNLAPLDTFRHSLGQSIRLGRPKGSSFIYILSFIYHYRSYFVNDDNNGP